MFERFNERARRVLFFARYETAQLGDREIGIEHLLLGITRENGGMVRPLLRWDAPSDEQLRKRIKDIGGAGRQVRTSIEVPFSEGTRRVLAAAMSEADLSGHAQVGVEHLLAGILRESSTAAGLLGREELTLHLVRERIRQSPGDPE